MKRVLYIGILLISSCELGNNSEDSWTKLEERIKRSNEENLSRARFEDSVYSLAKSNLPSAIAAIDKKIMNESDISYEQGLYFIKGDIYYSVDSFENAIQAFTNAMPSNGEIYPKYLAARAGAYIKIRRNDLAFFDLEKASKDNHGYLWNMGNYCEIIHEKQKAIDYYNQLYRKDTVVYKYCFDRINELRQDKPELFTELIYLDRDEQYLLQFK